MGAIKQQLEFIRGHVIPKSAHEKAKYFKHNKLALKLINRHINEIETESASTRLEGLEQNEAAWLVIEKLRAETLQNLEHIEATFLSIGQYNTSCQGYVFDIYQTGAES